MVERRLHPKTFFTGAEKEKIVEAIRQIEKNSSGEICVHLDAHKSGHVMDRAKRIFQKLGIAKTKHRNGILIYLSLSDRQFAILGDQGIHNRVGDQFWAEAAAKMGSAFSKGEFLKGVVDTIGWLGIYLKEHFPKEAGDKNELPNFN